MISKRNIIAYKNIKRKTKRIIERKNGKQKTKIQ
jgi:hypothetical protein